MAVQEILHTSVYASRNVLIIHVSFTNCPVVELRLGLGLECPAEEDMWVPSPPRPFLKDTRYLAAYYPFY